MRKLLWVLILSFSFSIAQDQHYWEKLSIQKVTNTKPGEWKLELKNPGNLTVTDSVAILVGTTEAASLRAQYITTLYITNITADTYEAIAETFDELKASDLSYIKIKSSNNKYNGLLTELGKRGLYFFDSTGKPYATINDLKVADKAREDKVLNAMLADVKKISSSDIIEAGTNQGKKISDISSASTLQTIRSFLAYSLKLAPAINQLTPVLTDYYSTWIKNGSVDASVIDQILKGSNQSKATLQSYGNQYYINSLLIALINSTEFEFRLTKNIDSYISSMSGIKSVCTQFLKGNELGYICFSLANALHSGKKFKEAKDQFQQAAAAYQNTDEVQFARSMSRIAECDEQLEDIAVATQEYNQAIVLWNILVRKLPTNYNYSRLRISLDGLARCLNVDGKEADYIKTQIALASVYKKLDLLLNRGSALWNIGYTFGVKLKQIETSNQYYEKAFLVFDSIKSISNAVTVICNKAINLRSIENYKDALEEGMRAEAYARANLDDKAEAYALENILSTYKKLENTEKAIETNLRLYKIYSLQNDDKNQAATQNDLASLYESIGKSTEATQATELALKHYLVSGDEKEKADAYWSAGYYLGADRWKESNAYYEKAFEYFNNTSTKGATTLLSNIAINFREINDSTKSFAQHKKAVAYAVGRSDTASMIYAHEKFYYSYQHFKKHRGMASEAFYAGYLYHNLKDADKAFEYYDKSLASFDSLIADYDRTKQYTLASNMYEAKGQIYLIKDQKVNQAEALFYAGYYLENQPGENINQKVLKFYQSALNIYIGVEDKYGAAIYVQNQMAKIYKSENKLDSAYYVLNKAIALGESKNDWSNLTDAYQLKAEYLASEKKYDGLQGALEFHRKAAASAGKLPDKTKQIQSLKNLALLNNELNRYSEAAKAHSERISLADKKDELKLADMYWEFGYSVSYIPSRMKESNELYNKAAEIFKKNHVLDNYVTVVSNIAYNYRDINDSTNAFKTIKNLVKSIESPKDKESESYFLALEKAGYVYKHFEKNKAAYTYRLNAAIGYEQLENLEKAFTLYEDAGKSAESARMFEEADLSYQRSLKIAEKLDSKAKQASARWSIAYNYGTNLNKETSAISVYELAYKNYLEAGDSANASIMRSNIGQVYWRLLDLDKAITNHELAIKIATDGKYFPQVASSWRKLADLYKETSNPTKQAAAIKNAISTLEILKDTTELIPLYIEIGASLSESQEIQKSSDYYNQALMYASAKKDSINIGFSNYKLGMLYNSVKPDRAKEYYSKAVSIQRKIKDQSNLVNSLASQGSLIMNDDTALSEKILNECLSIATLLNDQYIIGFAHQRLYDLYRNFGKSDIAHNHMDSAVKIYTELNQNTALANCYVTLANEYVYDYGDFTKSQEYMNQAMKMLSTVSNPFAYANFHQQQCNIYSDLGEYDMAIEELEEAMEVYTYYKSDWSLAGAYIDYGNIYKAIGEYEMALRYQEKSDSIYQLLNLQYQRLAPLANIGDIYFVQGDFAKSLDYFKRSVKYLEDNKDQNTNLCKLYLSLGAAYDGLGQFKEAESWFIKGLEVSRRVHATRTGAELLNYIGKLKIETREFDQAEKYLLEGKAFVDQQDLRVEKAGIYTDLGQLYVKKNELEKAKFILDEAIVLSDKYGRDAVSWGAYFYMGQYYRKANNLSESKNYLLRSVQVIEKLRNKIAGGEEAKKLFSSVKWVTEVYEELISVLLELGETEEAMAWLQKMNENNVSDKMRSTDVTFEDETKAKALAQEKELKLKLEAMEKQIVAQKQSKSVDVEQIKRLENIKNIAESDYLKFVNQTVNVQPELSKYFSNTVQPSQLKGKKKQIPKDMALVSYLVGEKQLYIFVATSDTVVAKIVSVAKEKIHRDVNAMTNLIKSHLGNFGSIDLKTQDAERKELVNQAKQTDPTLKPFEEAYGYLISPISELLVNKSRLGIIATGELNYIPFQLIGKTLKNGKFSLLINQYSLFYTNSTDMLLRATEVDKTLNILAFGNPDKTLPATEKEVNDIKKIFPTTKVYLRDDATEDKAKYAPEEYNVMHFATHGNLDYEDFSKSYLTMAGNSSKNEDGMLTLEELWGMDVMSHLNIVVLSACQTAVTKGSDESSPVSPASGFLQNGVKSVVASLWKVDDEATSILMNDFYKNIKTMDAVDAMRLAQSNLASIPKFNHPYYWAAMVLIGDWR